MLLGNAVRKFDGLDSCILRIPCNLTVGQRQLLCLARLFLRCNVSVLEIFQYTKALLIDYKNLALNEITAATYVTIDALKHISLHSLIPKNDKT